MPRFVGCHKGNGIFYCIFVNGTIYEGKCSSINIKSIVTFLNSSVTPIPRWFYFIWLRVFSSSHVSVLAAKMRDPAGWETKKTTLQNTFMVGAERHPSGFGQNQDLEIFCCLSSFLPCVTALWNIRCVGCNMYRTYSCNDGRASAIPLKHDE